MSKYSIDPIDLSGLRTVPLQSRGGKVKVSDFAAPHRKNTTVSAWLQSLPKVLAAEGLRALVDAVLKARSLGKPVIWGLGGHVIKCGLAPVLIDLMRRGFATAFALNGSASIHDFEIALAGHTSEDVEAVLPDGRFGTAEETGFEMNQAIEAGAIADLGLGESLGKRLADIANPSCAPHSLLLQAYRHDTPVTVHVAIGTDTPHTHPSTDPAALGATTHRDFRLFCSLVAGLNQGGVYVNAGSAVVMPEVFVKALSAARNLGHPVAGFTTVNLDFLQHYRPRVNVLERPHAHAGGKGIALTGHHEIMIPLIAAALIESEA